MKRIIFFITLIFSFIFLMGFFISTKFLKVQAIQNNEHIHSYAPKVTIEPTCINEGRMLHTCSCGESYIDKYISATDHVESDWIVEKFATENEEGKCHKKCTVCGEILKTKVLEPLGGNQNGTTVTIPTISCSNSLSGFAGIYALLIGAGTLYFIKKREK